MGKKRNRTSGDVATPCQSDTDNESPRSKRPKANRKGPKTSAEICAELQMENVELEFTEADYQNLTTFSLFSRLFRPQLLSANPKAPSSKVIQVMEAKWREFGKAKVASDRRRKEREDEEERQASKSSQDSDDSIQQGEDKESEAEASEEEEQEEEDTGELEEQEDLEESEDSEEDDSEKTVKKSVPRKSVSTLRIKMPMIVLRKSNRQQKRKDYNEEGESDSTSGSVRKRKSLSRKNQERDSDQEFETTKRRRTPAKAASSDNDSENDFEVKRRPSRKKSLKYKTQIEDSDPDSSKNVSASEDSQLLEDSSDSGDSSDDSRHKRRGKKVTPARPQIPGERKSDRARKGVSKVLSDKEFERMLRQEEKEQKEKRTKRKKIPKEKTVEVRSTKKLSPSPSPQQKPPEQDNADDGNESDHCWVCEICQDGGDLLLCDTCPKSFHKECLKISDIPEGDWSCPICTGEGLPEVDEESEVEHESFCRVCRDGGDVILCDFCPCVYHMRCCRPPLKEVPDGDWKCERCEISEMEPKGKIRTILTWRWSHQLKGTDELDHTHSPVKKILPAPSPTEENGETKEAEIRPIRELFVRYEYHSYWDCDWIPELMLEIHFPFRWHYFKRKFDMDEPPALEDGSSFGRKRHKDTTDQDPYKLEETFYRFGIKPEWLSIQRIITHQGKGRDMKYLVKWQDLGYDDCTWEYPGQVHRAMEEDFRRHIDSYWDRRKEKTQGSKKKEKPKKSMMKKKYDVQPDYISECGGKLHPYQLEGFNWIRFSYAQNTNTILADEMGLGKTVQTIVFLQSLFREGHSTGPFLISAPLSTVPNWEREFAFWAPELYVVTYGGHKESRMVIREHDFCYKDGAFAMLAKPCRMREEYRPKFDVLLTSYETVNTDQATLASIQWEVLVIDEAHRLKNNQSLFFQTMSQYKLRYKLLLTGTPLQNNLEELFNLLNFLEPDKFRDQENFLEEFDNVSRDLQVEKLHTMLAPHMLRRLKSDVLSEMPDKTELIVRVELSPMQKTFYKHILTKNFEALNVRGASNQTALMNIMMDLRKCCNHPYLFPTAQQEAPMTGNGLYEGTALIKACGKLTLLQQMLTRLRADNHRVLIFSQMTRCMDILEDFLDHMGFKYERLDGSVNTVRRQESIDRFNSEDSEQFVFLLSTKAGGLGINLATADTVIIYDMDWNPHNDIQAFSRAHRIGQKNKVMIYRFVSRNTIEEKMAQVCKRKMMLTELVIHRGMNSEKTDSLNKKEVSDILKYGAEDLFKDDDGGKGIQYDDEALEKLLDRSQDGEKQRESGMNDYLRSFRVASYQVKENVEEQVEEVQESTSAVPETEDRVYWEKVLGESHLEFTEQQLREQEEIARSLGKGKRLRRRINYAEKQAMLEGDSAKTNAKEKVVEDATYLSDYEPTSSSESDEERSDASDFEQEVKDLGVKKIPVLPERGRKEGAKVTAKAKELPPLMAKVNGHVEVLGFNARHRRAFLETVMKFGLPPDDVYNSKWCSRDLLNKSEKVFKAYASLFLRHLCEASSDNSAFFSDGVPREGLSRQHVLTRIGVIALIKKKVLEFEAVNGTDSMAAYDVGPRPVSGFRRGLLAKPSDERNPEAEQIVKLINDKKAIASNTTEKEKEIQKKEEETERKEEDIEKKEEETEKKEEETEKKAEETEKKEEQTEKKEEQTETKEVEEKKVEDTEKKEEGEKKEEEGEKKEEDTEKKEDDTEKEEVEEKKREDTEKKEEGKEKETEKEDNAEKKEEETEKKEDDAEKKEVEDEKKEEDTKNKDIKDKSDTATRSTERVESADSRSIGQAPTKAPFQTRTYPELAKALREKFWIADGGFTELHAFWQLEESAMDQRKPYQTWHRLHDFWLLAGTLVHGYRHWQDIINDARFEILNHVFRTDEARMKKAAFLNRRFQVLEQALVIEEQLSKAVKRNQGALPANVELALDRNDNLTALDKMASHLRKVNQTKDKGAVDKKLVKALNQVGSLVQDIKVTSTNMFSATLLKPSTAVPPVPASTSRKATVPPTQRRPGPTPAPPKGTPSQPSTAAKFVSQMLAEKQEKAGVGANTSSVICLD